MPCRTLQRPNTRKIKGFFLWTSLRGSRGQRYPPAQRDISNSCSQTRADQLHVVTQIRSLQRELVAAAKTAAGHPPLEALPAWPLTQCLSWGFFPEPWGSPRAAGSCGGLAAPCHLLCLVLWLLPACGCAREGEQEANSLTFTHPISLSSRNATSLLRSFLPCTHLMQRARPPSSSPLLSCRNGTGKRAVRLLLGDGWLQLEQTNPRTVSIPHYRACYQAAAAQRNPGTYGRTATHAGTKVAPAPALLSCLAWHRHPQLPSSAGLLLPASGITSLWG